MLRRACLLVFAGALCAFSAKAPNPDLAKIKNVYLLPMGNGLDQYIANRLTREGPYEVVTDPALADAIFTDKLGESFEARVKELYPPPPPPKVEKKEDAKDGDAKDGEKDSKSTEEEAVVIPEQPARISTWNRAKGNFFLVDRESKRVVWAYYGRAWSTQTDELHRLAEKVVDRLNADARGK